MSSSSETLPFALWRRVQTCSLFGFYELVLTTPGSFPSLFYNMFRVAQNALIFGANLCTTASLHPRCGRSAGRKAHTPEVRGGARAVKPQTWARADDSNTRQQRGRCDDAVALSARAHRCCRTKQNKRNRNRTDGSHEDAQCMDRNRTRQVPSRARVVRSRLETHRNARQVEDGGANQVARAKIFPKDAQVKEFDDWTSRRRNDVVRCKLRPERVRIHACSRTGTLRTH